MNEKTKVVDVDGGRIEIWQRDDGLFGVALLPDIGGPSNEGTTYTSTQDPDGFPATYDEDALEQWARKEWSKRLGH